ncbi:DUF3575 domain-containing protein [Robiginitomaculum antarcticum]|uniref:DUF3575 domain-containing protein n=1 Tax=Robiginitomaculum antarcticum TaxID=437507 RepID=UPI0003677979|nr:DUF3575 domain-containing protein [Robiginitomaculum antarcticum]
MRIAALAFSSVLISGCSWIGFGPQPGHNSAQQTRGGHYQNPQYGQPQAGYAHARKAGGPCTITQVTQPAPPGCRPEQVTIALPQYGAAAQAGAYPQQSAQRTYGPSSGAAVPVARRASSETHIYSRPYSRSGLRLNGTLGAERSVSGEALNSEDFFPLYPSAAHTEQIIVGTPADPQVVTTDYSVDNVSASGPGVSFSDLYGSVFNVGLGAEYFVTPRFAMTANATYGVAAGRDGGGATYTGNVNAQASVQAFADGAIPGSRVANGPPVVTTTTQTNAPVASTQFTVNDLQRANVELGGRHYFNAPFANYFERPPTPYIGASAGASHYNALEIKQDRQELALSGYAMGGAPTYTTISNEPARELIEEGWVPSGGLTAGVEWQVSPRASLGFETGVKYEGPRNKTAGGETDANISIPLTLRGSIGF